MYVSANDGTGIYQIPCKSYLNGQTTLNVLKFVYSEITNTNDGANCVNAAPPALPCGFPGLGGITADDPACVETTSIDVVDPVACATLGAIQHINTDNGPNGTGGSAPYSHLYTFDVDLVTGNIAPFDPPWGLDLNAHGIEEINATGINPLDDKMYGYAKLIDGGQGVVRFDQYGDLEWVSVGHGSWSIAGGFTPMERM